MSKSNMTHPQSSKEALFEESEQLLQVSQKATASSQCANGNIKHARHSRSENGIAPLDDVELMLLHEDFPKLLSLSAQVKGLRNSLVNAPTARRAVCSALSPEEIHLAVSKMREKLVGFSKQRHQSVKRGSYPVTDFAIDDSINTLQREYEHLNQWMATRSERKSRNTESCYSEKKSRKSNRDGSIECSESGQGAPLALKYSKWQTDILMNWMVEHIEQPFPDQSEIQSLMEQTGLSQHQVVNWTTNVRKRNRKATCEAGKKPHHFIDFMFLLHDRKDRHRKSRDTAVCQNRSLNLDSGFDVAGLGIRGKPVDDQDQGNSDCPPSNCFSSVEARSTSVKTRSTKRTTLFDERRVEEMGNLTHTEEDVKPPFPTTFCNFDDLIVNPFGVDEDIVEEDLLYDFADLWLQQESDWKILPSVTEDSDDSNVPGGDIIPARDMEGLPKNRGWNKTSSQKRSRAPSFDVETLVKEDIHSWAAEMGLTFDC